MASRLTKRLIESTEPNPGADAWIWDTDVRGFGVRVKPTGTRSFIVIYRNRSGRQRRLTIGQVGVYSLDKARDRARALLMAVREGRDPAQEIDDERAAPLISDLWDRFEREHLETRVRKTTRDSYRALWVRYIKPHLGEKTVAGITREEVVTFHGKLAHAPYSANRCLAVLSKMLTLAEQVYKMRTGANPCRGVKRYKEHQREMILDRTQIAALWRAFDQYDQEHPRSKHLTDFFRLTLMTGTRKGEWINAQWPMVDLERELLVLPEAMSKTGAKLVELPPPAVEILKRRREAVAHALRFRPNLFVVGPREGETAISHPYHAWREIVAAAGIPGGLRPHDLRHVFASIAHRSGASQRTVSQLLGHKTLAMTERYIQGFSELRREAARTTSAAILDAITSGSSASVSRLRGDAPQTGARASGGPSKRPRPRKTQAR